MAESTNQKSEPNKSTGSFLSKLTSGFSKKSYDKKHDPLNLGHGRIHEENLSWQQMRAQNKVVDTRYTSNQSLEKGKINKSLEAFESLKQQRERPQHTAQVRASLPLFYRMINPGLIAMMKRMGYTNAELLKWEQNRIRNSIIYGALIIGIGSFKIVVSLNIFIVIVLGIAVGLFTYSSAGKTVKNKFQLYKFNREMQFSKFSRLLVPYLVQVSNGQSLWQIFKKIEPRLDDPIDQRLLQTLMVEMSEDSESAEPFVRFARAFSTDPFSVLFMRAVNNMKQSGSDVSVIMSLSKEANQRLIDKVEAIRIMKFRKFSLYTTYITMLTMTLIGSQLVAVIIEQVSTINF